MTPRFIGPGTRLLLPTPPRHGVALEDGVALKYRSGKDIETFPADSEKRRGIADRQVRRAELALRITYEMFLPGLVSCHGRTLSQTNKLVKMFELFSS